MALKGDLQDFSITQLLNLVNLAQKTGTMAVKNSSDSAEVVFRNGKLAYASFGKEDCSLAGVLLRSNKISAQQYRIICERANTMTDKEIGMLLVNSGYLTQKEVINSLHQSFSSVVRRLFTWDEGSFNFDNDSVHTNGKILVRLDIENLIMEGSRQVREKQYLADEIPNLEMSLRFTDRPGANIRNVTLSVEEWKVVSYINPKNTIQQIARVNKMSDLEIRRIVYGLLQAGLVEFVRPAALQANIPVMAPAQKQERKSLVNRLIDRIRSL